MFVVCLRSPNPCLARIVFALSLCFGLTIRPVSGQEDGAPIPRAERVPETYRLSPNDVVRITVFQEDDLSTVTRISKDGTLQFPLIGRARVGGSSLQGAVEILERQLREYLVRPQVAITVLDYSKRRFTIMGQVNRPGSFDMPDEASVNLIEAIGMAGGYTRIANASKVILKREEDGVEKTYRLDAKRMSRDEDMERFPVLPGDTIIVGESIF